VCFFFTFHTTAAHDRMVSILPIIAPICGSLAGVFTIVSAYQLSMKSGAFPKGIVTPPISFFATGSAARSVYATGFTITGLILCVVTYYFGKLFVPHVSEDFPQCSWYSYWAGYVSAFGVIAQGVVMLEDNAFNNLVQGNGQAMQSVSIYHQLLALFFFQGAACHCYSATYMVWNTNKAILQTTKYLRVALAVLTVMGSPVAQLIHPAFTKSIGMSPQEEQFNMGGILQWIIVGTYIVYFSVYSIDFYILMKAKDDAKAMMSKSKDAKKSD